MLKLSAMPSLDAFVLITVTLWSLANASAYTKWPINDCYRSSINLFFICDPINRMDTQIDLYQKLLRFFSPNFENEQARLTVNALAFPSNRNSSQNAISLVSRRIRSKEGLNDVFNDQSQYKSLPLNRRLSDMVYDAVTRHVSILPSSESTAFIATANARSIQHWCQNTSRGNTKSHPFCHILVNEAFVVILEEEGFTINSSIVNMINNKRTLQRFHPLNVCNPCKLKWLSSLVDSGDQALNPFSCYSPNVHNSRISWADAARKCSTEGSELVSIETKEELLFLAGVVQQHPSSAENYSVCIGLRREDYTLGRRFCWISQMPLVHTLWGRGEPRNGLMNGCAVWTFDIHGASNNTSGSRETGENRLHYWRSIGCDVQSCTRHICEINFRRLPLFRDAMEYNFSSIYPNITSIDRALQHGKLLYTDDNTSFVALMEVPVTKTVTFAKSEEVLDLSTLPMFNCGKRGKIFYNFLCSFPPKCIVKCLYPVCGPGEYQCRSGQCIAESRRCDLFKDCLDGDDEINCYKCQHARCKDGRCLPKHWFGDGEADCNACRDQDVENEMRTAGIPRINDCVFVCNRTECVNRHMLNDGVIDCQGPEGPLDETLGALEATTCYNVTTERVLYSNWAPNCVYVKDSNGELIGCRNMKHLENCETFQCPEGYVKCPWSYCIPYHYVHNGNFDCPNGEDESSGAAMDCSGYFVCYGYNGRKMCLHPDYVCDGQKQCPQGDDEINCDVKCMKGLLCISGVVMVVDHSVEADLNMIEKSTQYVDLSGVFAPKVLDIRPENTLFSLVEARFSNCSIERLNYSCRLHSLTALDLSFNLIDKVASDSILVGMILLAKLNLSHNAKLSHIDSYVFSRIPIETLDISFTSIDNLRFLNGMRSLRTLSLQNTPIAIERLVSAMNRKTFTMLDLRGIQDENISLHMFSPIKISVLKVDNFKLCCPQLYSVSDSLKSCQTMGDPFSSCSDLISSPVLRIILWTVGVFAVVGNAAVIGYRLMRDRKSFTMGYGHFVTHLGCSDLLMGVYLISVAVADVHYRGGYLLAEHGWRNGPLCRMLGFLSTLSSEVSIFFIFLITLDRFLVIRFPFGQVRIRNWEAVGLCALTWPIGAALALAPGSYYLGEWSMYNRTGVCVGLPFNPQKHTAWLYSQSIFIYCNAALFLLIAVGQCVIYRTMLKMRMDKGLLACPGTRRSQDVAVANKLLIVVISDFLCWFPIGVLGVLNQLGYEMDSDVYSWTAVLVLPINSAINPILYTVPAFVQKSTLCKNTKSRPATKNTTF